MSSLPGSFIGDWDLDHRELSVSSSVSTFVAVKFPEP